MAVDEVDMLKTIGWRFGEEQSLKRHTKALS